MTAQIISGKLISETILEEVKNNITLRAQAGKRAPCLAVVLVGSDPASAIYVRNKRLACEKVGIVSIAHQLPDSTTQQALLALIDTLNADPNVDGILVQSPLPTHIHEDELIEHISVHKDVDGFHPYNIGRLAVRQPTLRSCTPFGVMKLLKSTGLNLMGFRRCGGWRFKPRRSPNGFRVIVGRLHSDMLSSPHQRFSRYSRPRRFSGGGSGQGGLGEGEWIKSGAIVIDIGINRLPDGKICGDVEFEVAQSRAAWITPVPGGVGPMTVATLMENTLLAQTLKEND